MNVYRVIGDALATLEGRELAERLVAWHDAMVKHLRAISLRGASCTEGCAHEEARLLWAEANDVFGEEAARLSFLRTHGAGIPAGARSQRPMEARV